MREEAPAASPGPAPAGDAGPASAGTASSPWALAWRIASGLVFVPLLVLLARAGGIAFLAFVALEVALGLGEFYGMMRGRGLNPFQRLGIASGLALLWVTYRPLTPHVGFLVTKIGRAHV